MNGILLIDKPAGITSFDVVYQIKKKFNLKKVGHTGTLDPFATGLMIVLVGQATKLAFLFNELDKEYQGKIVFGNDYDTFDVTGKILDFRKPKFSKVQLDAAIANLPKQTLQRPPIYSAIKVNGQKSYDLARSGKDPKLALRPVTIYKFDVIKYHLDFSLEFETLVSKGTYIRSLAYDLGLTLNTYGALATLKRTAIGPYPIDQATTIEKCQAADLIADTTLFGNLPKLVVNDFVAKLVENGVYLDQRHTQIKSPFVVSHNNEFLAYYVPVNDQYQPKYFFKDK